MADEKSIEITDEMVQRACVVVLEHGGIYFNPRTSVASDYDVIVKELLVAALYSCEHDLQKQILPLPKA